MRIKFVFELEEKRPLGRFKCTWQNDTKELDYDGTD
jgi:hypothetical protein